MRVRQGFSIAETILAMGLIAAVLLLVVDMFPQAWWLSRMKQHQLTARRIAASVVHEAATQPQLEPGQRDLEPVSLDGIKFSPRLSVEPVSGSPRLVYLRASVSYTSLTNQAQTVVQELEVCHLEGH